MSLCSPRGPRRPKRFWVLGWVAQQVLTAYRNGEGSVDDLVGQAMLTRHRIPDHQVMPDGSLCLSFFEGQSVRPEEAGLLRAMVAEYRLDPGATPDVIHERAKARLELRAGMTMPGGG